MTCTWRTRAASVMLGLSLAASGSLSAHAERWPGTTASIGGAIAARIIAVKCAATMTPAEIAELDAYIDERQTAFMTGSRANQRFGESVFPRIAREYDFSYSRREACTAEARAMATDMLTRVRAAEAELEKQAELKQ